MDRHTYVMGRRQLPANGRPNVKSSHRKSTARLEKLKVREEEKRRELVSIAREKGEKGLSTAKREVGLVGGVVAPPIGFASAYMAVGAEKHFNWYVQNISGLEQGRLGLPLTSGLMMTGGLIATYTYGLRKSLPKTRLYDMGTITLGQSSLGFMAAPLFNSSSQPHYYLSGDFFFGFPVALATLGTGMIKNDEVVAGGFTITAAGGAASAVIMGMLTKHPVPAAYEIMESSFVGVWMAITSTYLLLKHKFGWPSIVKKKANDAQTTGGVQAQPQ